MDWPTAINADVSKYPQTSSPTDLDLQIARKLLKSEANRKAKIRYYEKNAAVLNKKRRAAYAKEHQWLTDSLVFEKQVHYGRKWLAHELKISPRTLALWVVRGTIPEGRITLKGKQYYTKSEAVIIINAYRLVGNNLSGIYGPDRAIVYKKKKTTFKRLVWDEILEIRRKAQWKKS
jgi:hypothetical protein